MLPVILVTVVEAKVEEPELLILVELRVVEFKVVKFPVVPVI